MSSNADCLVCTDYSKTSVRRFLLSSFYAPSLTVSTGLPTGHALIQLVRKHAIDGPKTEEEIKAITDKYSTMELFRQGNDKLRELRSRLVQEKVRLSLRLGQR